MDYKEKYEKALEWMKSIYPTMQGSDKEDAEHYFPELRESEDERIRKELIFFLKGEIPQCSIQEHADKLKEFVSYLEKLKDLDKMLVVSPDVWDNAINDAYENGKKDSEKQKEQKPADGKELLYVSNKSYNIGYRDGKREAEQKPEWSEEDEKMLSVITYKISQHQGNDERSLFTPDEAEFICEMEDKFKSLHPVPHWKPSEEQMEALTIAAFISKTDYNTLTSLLIDLKKLREDKK